MELLQHENALIQIPSFRELAHLIADITAKISHILLTSLKFGPQFKL